MLQLGEETEVPRQRLQVQGLGCRVSGFRVSGFRVSRFRVSGLGLKFGP